MNAPPTCRRGLHPMEGDNAGVQASTGRRFCRACRNERRRAARAAAREAGEVRPPPTVEAPGGEAADEAPDVDAVPRVPPPTVPPPTVPLPTVPSRAPGRAGREAAALHRHALMVRGLWRPSVGRSASVPTVPRPVVPE